LCLDTQSNLAVVESVVDFSRLVAICSAEPGRIMVPGSDPEFPVELGSVGEVHAAFSIKPHTWNLSSAACRKFGASVQEERIPRAR
jgi:hypothetical protein